MGGERRRHPRFSVGIELRVAVLGYDEVVSATLLDLSRGGCRFATTLDLVVGTSVEVVLHTRRGTECSGSGRVVRARAGEVAVRFDAVNAALTRLAARLAAMPARRRAQLIATSVEPGIHII